MEVSEYTIPKISPHLPERIDGNYFKTLQNIFYALDQFAIIAVTDKKGDIIYVNKKFCEISKYSQEELIGRNHRILKSGHHHPAFYKRMWKTISSGHPWTGEIKNKAKDGTFYWVKTHITPIFDETGIITEYVSLRVLITQEKNLEETLRKTSEILSVTERKYRHIFQNSTNMLRVIDMNGIIRDCNRSYLKKLGYAKSEIIGKSIFDHVSEKSVDALHDSFSAWKIDKQVFNQEIWLKRKDGSTFPTQLNATTIYGPQGEIIGSNTIITDMTEIYYAKKEIETNQRVIKQQLIDLKKVDDQKDEFISMVAHELRTPLTAIMLHCDTLTYGGIAEELSQSQSEEIDAIYRNSERLAKEIDSLLDAQKLEMEKMKFDIDEFRVDGFLLDVFKDHLLAANKKRIKLVNSTKGSITIKSDRNRLSQVFNNLINNAISFVPHGTGRIEIGVKEHENDVLCYVIDNGPGIPQEKQKGIFKKFYQVDTSISREHMGTGLGLSVCKGIVEGLGGKIWFESKEGKGTSFYFTIPRRRE